MSTEGTLCSSGVQAMTSNARRIYLVQFKSSLQLYCICYVLWGSLSFLLPVESFCSSIACSERLGSLWLLGIGNMLVAFLLHLHLHKEGLQCFSPMPGDCNAAAAALLNDALRHFVLLTADCLGDRYWWVQDGVPYLWRECNLHKYRRKLHLLVC